MVLKSDCISKFFRISFVIDECDLVLGTLYSFFLLLIYNVEAVIPYKEGWYKKNNFHFIELHELLIHCILVNYYSDIAEMLLKLALNTNQSIYFCLSLSKLPICLQELGIK